MSSQQRFFVAPEAIEHGQVRFNREQARQMMAVLRMAPGQTVTVLDNSGWQYLVALERLSSADAVGAVRTRTLVSSEPRTKVTLYVGMIRAPRLEIVLQKCTELGVVAFVPVLCQRSLVGQADELNPDKLDHLTSTVPGILPHRRQRAPPETCWRIQGTTTSTLARTSVPG